MSAGRLVSILDAENTWHPHRKVRWHEGNRVLSRPGAGGESFQSACESFQSTCQISVIFKARAACTQSEVNTFSAVLHLHRHYALEARCKSALDAEYGSAGAEMIRRAGLLERPLRLAINAEWEKQVDGAYHCQSMHERADCACTSGVGCCDATLVYYLGIPVLNCHYCCRRGLERTQGASLGRAAQHDWRRGNVAQSR